jgi:hypothetical protein
LSPNQNATPIYLKCGMRTISDGFELYPVTAACRGIGTLRAPNILTVPRAIRQNLPEAHQRILDDHLPYACRHYLVRDGLDVTYVVTKRRWRASFPQLPITEVLYVSDHTAFQRHFHYLVGRICVAERCVGMAVDRALLGGNVPKGGIFRARHRLGKGDDIELAARDSLYSEMVLLDG